MMQRSTHTGISTHYSDLIVVRFIVKWFKSCGSFIDKSDIDY